MSQFNKPAVTVQDQISILQSRGLTIKNPERAEKYIEVISYFRLSAYMRPFHKTLNKQSVEHQFKDGTEFKQIVGLYSFDRELRLLIMDAIERFEVAVRATLNNTMATKYQNDDLCSGSHWYLNESLFKSSYQHKRLLKEIEDKQTKEFSDLQRDINKIERSSVEDEIKSQRIERRVRENYARFYQHSYDSPKLMPGWAMVEELTLGSISHLYRGLAKDIDRKVIARRFCLPQEVLESWLHTLNFVRNCCAHHSRLWNRELSVQPKIPNGGIWQLPERLEPSQIQPRRRIFMVLLMLAHLMRQVSPESQWHNKIKALVTLHPEIPKFPMGFPNNWMDHDFFSS
ncbi:MULTISPECIES: Abi family protein [Gammaproteobacteria]|uniref:Abi family protein n=1 Tax=Gammaproteobacteria TaxID=1236 RepID=UPI000DCFF4A9|nr:MULTISPECIES: Abi family protein [Gammaproteobacteria]RTE85926.1 Abi family protein [Aliidiomarina sp. B3213]TCZ90075.1 Abi family protein [Lysobacter sp. N42]